MTAKAAYKYINQISECENICNTQPVVLFEINHIYITHNAADSDTGNCPA